MHSSAKTLHTLDLLNVDMYFAFDILSNIKH